MFATRIFGCQMDYEHPEATALEGIERLQVFIKDVLKLPTTISEIGGKMEDVPELCKKYVPRRSKPRKFREADSGNHRRDLSRCNVIRWKISRKISAPALPNSGVRAGLKAKRSGCPYRSVHRLPEQD